MWVELWYLQVRKLMFADLSLGKGDFQIYNKQPCQSERQVLIIVNTTIGIGSLLEWRILPQLF